MTTWNLQHEFVLRSLCALIRSSPEFIVWVLIAEDDLLLNSAREYLDNTFGSQIAFDEPATPSTRDPVGFIHQQSSVPEVEGIVLLLPSDPVSASSATSYLSQLNSSFSSLQARCRKPVGIMGGPKLSGYLAEIAPRLWASRSVTLGLSHTPIDAEAIPRLTVFDPEDHDGALRWSGLESRVLRHILADEQVEPAIRTGALLRSGERSAITRDFGVAGRFYQEAFDLAVANDNRRQQVSCLVRMASLSQRRFLVAESAALYREALRLSVEIPDPLQQSSCLVGLGTIELRAGNFMAAESLYREALSLSNGQPIYAREALSWLAETALLQHWLDDAEELGNQALAHAREAGVARLIAADLCHLGDIARQRSRAEQARSFYQAARSVGSADPRIQLTALVGLAESMRWTYRWEFIRTRPGYPPEMIPFDAHPQEDGYAVKRRRDKEIRDLYGSALEHAQTVGDAVGQSYCLRALGRIDEALGVARECGDLPNEAWSLLESTLLPGDRALTMEYSRKALELTARAGDFRLRLACLLHLAEAHRSRGRFGDAIDLARQATALAQEKNDRSVRPVCLRVLASALADRGRAWMSDPEGPPLLEEAERCYGQALEAAQEIGDLDEQALGLWARGQTAQLRAQFDEDDYFLFNLEARSSHMQPAVPGFDDRNYSTRKEILLAALSYYRQASELFSETGRSQLRDWVNRNIDDARRGHVSSHVQPSADFVVSSLQLSASRALLDWS